MPKTDRVQWQDFGSLQPLPPVLKQAILMPQPPKSVCV
uniref:Moesin n=1 Tax=Homo sapiens TaxID=9606 RepID=A0A8V8TKQ0_HUMAN